MTSISTDGHAAPESQSSLLPQSSLLQRAGEQAFTLLFLGASAVATVGWLYVLGEGTLAFASWLFF